MRSSTRSLAQIALMTACIIILGFIPPIPLGFIPVPIIVQNLGIMLAGVILGPKKGTLSVWLFMLMVLIGMPFLTGQTGGPAAFYGPSSGYMFAWLIIPFFTGSVIEHFKLRRFSLVFLSVWIFGALMGDSLGALWLSWFTHITLKAAFISSMAFIPGDTVKALLAAWIGSRIARQISKLTPSKSLHLDE